MCYNVKMKNIKIVKTDWSGVAESYDKYLNSDKNYHSDLILPSLIRMISKGDNDFFKNKKILDIACGQGQLSDLLQSNGAKVEAFDLGENLIKIARDKNKNINYKIADAQDFAKHYTIFDQDFLTQNQDIVNLNNKGDYKDNIKIIQSSKNIYIKNLQTQKIKDNIKSSKTSKVLSLENLTTEQYQKFDIVTCVLAIQNIENVKKVLENIRLISHEGTKIYFIINHPSFRIPKASSWGYDQIGEGNKNRSIQYRRIDKYMSEDKIKIDMNPNVKADKSGSNKSFVYSYHRPIQYFFKLFSNSNMCVSRLEEWISNRESIGKHADRENIARKEIPMFMCLEVVVR